MSSAIKVLRAAAAYFTPALWYGSSGSPATDMSASVALGLFHGFLMLLEDSRSQVF